jgi:hypothetical protein
LNGLLSCLNLALEDSQFYPISTTPNNLSSNPRSPSKHHVSNLKKILFQTSKKPYLKLENNPIVALETPNTLCFKPPKNSYLHSKNPPKQILMKPYFKTPKNLISKLKKTLFEHQKNLF